MEIKRVCFCCEKVLTQCRLDGEDGFDNPPNDATYWRTHGNYGSTIFDPGMFADEQLEMFICDECLKAKSHLVYHFRTFNKQEIRNLKFFSEVQENDGY